MCCVSRPLIRRSWVLRQTNLLQLEGGHVANPLDDVLLLRSREPVLSGVAVVSGALRKLRRSSEHSASGSFILHVGPKCLHLVDLDFVWVLKSLALDQDDFRPREHA